MGGAGDHTAWAFQVPAFAAEFDVIALDNRGAGQSGAPDTRYTVGGMADDVAGLMDQPGGRGARILGGAGGGSIAPRPALPDPPRALPAQRHPTPAPGGGSRRAATRT